MSLHKSHLVNKKNNTKCINVKDKNILTETLVSSINKKQRKSKNHKKSKKVIKKQEDIILVSKTLNKLDDKIVTNVETTDIDIPQNIDTNKKDPEEIEGKWSLFIEEFNTVSSNDTNNNITINYINSIKKSIDISLEQKNNFEIKKIDTECYQCNGNLIRQKDIVICQHCGIELKNNTNITEEQYSTSAMTECNVNINGFIPIKITGKGSYGYQRSLLKTCASYKKYRKNTTLKDMNNWNVQSVKHHIPKSVIREANDIFATIKENGYVFRKDGKKGVLSACLYYACYNNNITKTPSEVASFSGIEEKFHSLGDRILCDLNERGVISIPVKINPINDYVERYMESLEIPKISKDGKNYHGFVIDIIYRAEKNLIHILHDSKNNTKCVGAIYMLIERVPHLRKKISKEYIDNTCGISKTTFIRYYNILCKFYRKFKKSFKRYGIPMKKEWRDVKIVKKVKL